MARLIPGIPTDIFARIDDLLAHVHPLLGRVDSTLVDVETTLVEATAVLTDVRTLLVDLEAKLGLLDDVPVMRAQLDEMHAMLSTLSNGTPPKKAAARKKS